MRSRPKPSLKNCSNCSGVSLTGKTQARSSFAVSGLMKNHGLKPDELIISESAVRDIIRYYTREAGVRALERELSKICRKTVKTLLSKPSAQKITVTSRNLDKFSGVRRYTFGIANQGNVARHHVEGLIVFAIALGITSGALAGLHFVAPEPVEVAPVIDLMEALKASVAAARKQPAADGDEAPAKPARSRRAKSKAS